MQSIMYKILKKVNDLEYFMCLFTANIRFDSNILIIFKLVDKINKPNSLLSKSMPFLIQI